MHNYKELKVWQRSMDLAHRIYTISKLLPKEEMYGLQSQIRRSAVSVPSKIAEGCGRNSDKQLLQFLQIAQGSLSELETQLILLDRTLNIKIEEEIKDEILEIQKMLRSFQNKFSQKKN